MNTPKYINRLEQCSFLDVKELETLKPVTERFDFRANEYYLNLIDWEEPKDPIRRIVIPDPEELLEWGELDPSQEHKYTIIPGLQHKYNSTALFLVSDECAGYCRFCFRKRLFLKNQREVLTDLEQGLNYLKAHSEITNLLLTGGDPLFLPTEKLKEIIAQVRTIDHIQIIRIGSKMPAYNPFRIINDPSLLEMIQQYSKPRKRIYLITHFNHPRELSEPAWQAVNQLIKAGAILCNQTPLIRGVNDNPWVLSQLFSELSYIGIAPYYVFQCRPTVGNHSYSVPIEEGYKIFEQARMNCSGLAKRVRFILSHDTGKIEIIGRDGENIYFKYHMVTNNKNDGHLLIFKSNPGAYWLDDYREARQELA